jgi:hypothetical protein
MQPEKTDKLEQIAAANALLASEGKWAARWWSYTASLNAFELLVGDPSGTGNLVLVMAGCTHISGPVAWPSQRLRVTMLHPTEDDQQSAFELRDNAVGFVAKAPMFSFHENWNLLEVGSVMFPTDWRASDT